MLRSTPKIRNLIFKNIYIRKKKEKRESKKEVREFLRRLISELCTPLGRIGQVPSLHSRQPYGPPLDLLHDLPPSSWQNERSAPNFELVLMSEVRPHPLGNPGIRA